MGRIFEIIKEIEEDIDKSYCLGYDNNEDTLDSAKESLEYLKEQLALSLDNK